VGLSSRAKEKHAVAVKVLIGIPLWMEGSIPSALTIFSIIYPLS
jgi:hypothetical protein